MRAVVRKFNKFSSFPLIVEAGRDLTGFVSFSHLEETNYLIGDIITVYFDETIEEWHYFRLSANPKTKPKTGDLISCRFVKFKQGFGATV